MIAEQLKRSILQAAIQGKLTDQLPEDGDARDLLKNIEKEKSHLIKEGKIKKEKPLPEISEDEIPFDIPESWCWVRLGTISEFIDYRGKTPIKTESGVRLITAKNVKDGYISITPEEFINPNNYEDWMTRGIPNKGDILFTTEAPLGNTAIVDLEERFALAQRIIAIQLLGSSASKFLMYYLQSSELRKLLREKSTGTTVLGIKASKLREILVPLPPITEQHRIVERVDRLLPEIDKLKNDESKLDTLQKSFPKKMKDSVLQYAIQGKLTEQLPEDGNAKDLVKDIQKEKARLIKEGKIKKEKPLPAIPEDEIPFDIPESWRWVRLGEVVLQNVGGGTPSKSNPNYWNGGIPWASVKDLNCTFLDSTLDNISEAGLKNSSSNFIPKGNLIVCTRMGLGKIVYNNIDVAINQDLRALLLPSTIDKWYVYYFYLTLNFTGKGATVKGISLIDLSNTLFPLPPLSEQNRIVQRLEEILPLCETLE